MLDVDVDVDGGDGELVLVDPLPPFDSTPRTGSLSPSSVCDDAPTEDTDRRHESVHLSLPVKQEEHAGGGVDKEYDDDTPPARLLPKQDDRRRELTRRCCRLLLLASVAVL
jgi:hypothetical protein